MLGHKIHIKSKDEVQKMVDSGKRLAEVKEKLIEKVADGVSAYEIEILATKLIEKTGGHPSFKMVPGYSWSTCVNVNDGIVHGIPKKDLVFQKGDVVSVDVGLYFRGFHTDTSFTKGIDVSKKVSNFLEVGKKAFRNAIEVAVDGKRVYDISYAIEGTLKKNGFFPVRALVGHGVGKNLHEAPEIPCFVYGKRNESPILKEGMTLAIEVMYVMGESDLILEDDGWTIATRDGKISALYEDTVLVGKNGSLVLTESKKS